MSDNLELLLRCARAGAEAIAPELQADEDWQPVALAVKEGSVSIVGLPGELLESQHTKDVLAYLVLPFLGVRLQAEAMAMLTSSWMKASNDSRSRVEGLTVFASDGEHEALQIAEIIRSEDQHPTLEWHEPYVSEEWGELGGRFPESLRAAVRITKADLVELFETVSAESYLEDLERMLQVESWPAEDGD